MLLESYVQAAPKAELHVHLEGAIQPALLSTHFGLDVSAIDEILLNSVRCCFLPEQQRQELELAFRTELAVLKARHF